MKRYSPIKMHKLCKIMIGMIVLTSSLVYGALTDNLLIYLDMGSLTDSSGNGNDFQYYGTPDHWNNASCHIGNTCTSFVNSAPNPDELFYMADFYDNVSSSITDNSTINFWWHSFDTGAFTYQGNEGVGGGQKVFITGGNIQYYDGAGTRNTGVAVYSGTWSMFTITYDHSITNFTIWINGTIRVSSAGNAKTGADAMFFGVGGDTEGTTLVAGDVAINGLIDDFAYWERPLSATEIDELWNNGAGYNFLLDVTAPTIEIISPDDSYNETYNEAIWINISINEVGNCSINNTDFTPHWENSTYFSWTESALADGTYSVFINCSDDDDNMGNDTTYFSKDTANPYISEITAVNLTNSSYAFQTENNRAFGWRLILYDNLDIFDFIYNLSWNNGTLISSTQLNLSETTETEYSLNVSYDLRNYTNETYDFSYELCDSHTAKDIKKFGKVENKLGLLNFTVEDFSLSLETDYSNSLFETVYIGDRYKIIETGKINDKHVYTLKSSVPIFYIEDSPYKGHFVAGRHWIDFEPYNVKVYPYQDYFRVELITDDVRVEFDSIGELNCVYGNWTVEMVHTPPTPEPEYNASLIIGHTDWFNVEALDYNTTAGALMWFFMFAVIVALVVFAEVMRVPAIRIIVGITAFFYSFLLYAGISAVLGGMFAVLSFMYIVVGVLMAKY